MRGKIALGLAFIIVTVVASVFLDSGVAAHSETADHAAVEVELAAAP